MSQPNDAASVWISVPIVKYSHVTITLNKRIPPWIHEPANTLTFVIQAVRVVDDEGKYERRVMMKIFRGAEVLESQNLSQLVQYCRQLDPQHRGEKTIEVKCQKPKIAMRYPKTGDIVRKVQIRFQNDTHSSQVVDILKELGYLVEEITGPPPSRPLASSASATLSSSSASKTADYPPNAPVRLSSAIASTALPNDGRSSVLSSSASSHEFNVPVRPATSESHRDSFRDSFSSSQRLPVQLSAPMTNSEFGAPVSLSRSGSFHEPVNSLYLSQIERQDQIRRMSQPISQVSSYGSIDNSSNSSHFPHQMQSKHEGIIRRANVSPPHLSSSPFFTSLQSETRNEGLIFNHHLGPSPSQRPASTPVDIQDRMIPPRRELPFSRPEIQSRSSSAADLRVTLPKPTPLMKAPPDIPRAATSSTEPVSKAAPVKRVAERKAPVVKPVQNHSSSDSSPVKPTARGTVLTPPVPEDDEPSPLAAKSALAASRPASAASGLLSKAIVPPKRRAPASLRPASSNKRPKMVDQSTQTQAISADRPVEIARTDAGPVRAVTDITTITPVSAALTNELDAFVAKHGSRPVPKEFWQMPGYSEADEEYRHSMLNDFICENLENPEFLQLCTDMEFSWHRIGLGL